VHFVLFSCCFITGIISEIHNQSHRYIPRATNTSSPTDAVQLRLDVTWNVKTPKGIEI